MQSKADEFLERAARCKELADTLALECKSDFERLAKMWNVLAEEELADSEPAPGAPSNAV
jgi:hypothetical protein